MGLAWSSDATLLFGPDRSGRPADRPEFPFYGSRVITSRARVIVIPLVAALAACSPERTTGVDGSLTQCGNSGAVAGSFGEANSFVSATPGLTSDATPPYGGAALEAVLSVAPLSGAVVSYPSPSVQLNDTAARYLVVPQFAVQGSMPDSTAFRLTVGSGALAVATRIANGNARRPSVQSSLDLRLRRLEAGLPADQRLSPRAAPPSGASTTAPDSVRSFYVLGSLTGNCFVQTQARLKYTGARVYVYEDIGVASGFSASEYAKFGTLFDDVLYPIDTAAFGFPSDVDGNGHIIVLLSQKINQLTSRAECTASGAYVAGYFFGYDLTNGSGSNRSEVFYSVAPDSTAQFSCAHRKSQVGTQTPTTFIHEFQHMISYNQHVLLRQGQAEVTWLNEGLSHIAEELGSKYYEAKYPAPSGRTVATQLFPDSSQGFINPNFRNAYFYLLAPRQQSVTTFAALGTLEERGAAWLFLRWLGDQKGDQIYKQLVGTTRRGTDNVSAAAGEPFPALFGDFGIATYTDSIDGVPRTAVPERYRFRSRNTRQIFGRLFPLRPNPIATTQLGCAGAATQRMLQGTSSYFLTGAPAGCSGTRLSMTADEGSALPPTLLPQLAIFRLP